MIPWLRRITTREMALNTLPFSFKSYDAIGLDLDHTIALYNLDRIIELQYTLLVDYLVKNGYKSDVFSKKLSKDNVDFLQRGLFLDLKKGNILKVGEDGTILSATHGTKRMSDNEVLISYGKDRKWDLINKFVEDKLSIWGPPISDEIRSMMEFFDCQVPLVFGQAIDSIDGDSLNGNEYTVWPQILLGVINMFEPHGGFYKALYNDPALYLRKCKPQIAEWLQNLRRDNKLLFLLTGSREKEASFLANYSLGAEWKSYFDFIIYQAKKPGFFSQDRPFTEEKTPQNLSQIVELTQGNWKKLYSLISDRISVVNPRCVYIGDNLVQDVFATSLTSNIDAVALIEELSEEGNSHENNDRHPCAEYLKSSFWGSYIYSSDGKCTTVWGDIMRKYSKLNIPSLDYVTSKPIDYVF